MNKTSLVLASLVVASAVLLGSVALANIISGNVSTSSSAHATYTLLTINVPASVVSGDLLLANIDVNGGTPANVTPPTGWTQILRTDNDTDISMISYWKIASASEPTNYTWTINSQTRAEGGITQYSGINPTNPIEISAGNFGFGKIATTSSVTTSSANEEVVALYGFDAGDNTAGYFSTPTGMTEKYDVTHIPFGPSTAADDAVQVTVGTSGSNSSTIAGNKNRNWVSQIITLKMQSPNTASISLQSSLGEFVQAPNSPSLAITGNMTAEAWIKLASLPGTGTSPSTYVIVDKTTGTSQDAYQFDAQNIGGVQMVSFGFGQTFSAFPWMPQTNTWYHVVGTYSTSGVISIYVNGTLIGSQSGFPSSMNNNNAPFTIGSTRGVGFFDGKIDDIRVYNVTRTQSQIQSDMFVEPAGTESGLMGAWSFDNALTDSTANHNDLTNYGTQFSTDSPF
jgi:hypothetical protein